MLYICVFLYRIECTMSLLRYIATYYDTYACINMYIYLYIYVRY